MARNPGRGARGRCGRQVRQEALAHARPSRGVHQQPCKAGATPDLHYSTLLCMTSKQHLQR